jgi:2-dehydropantoate 2-reductase
MEAASTLAIVGSGSLGQSFAGLLAAQGREVTLLATASGATPLLEAGAIRLRGAIEADFPVAAGPSPAGVVGVTADAAKLPAETGLIFATKGHQLPAAIASVRSAWPRPGDTTSWVAGIQNGLVKDDLLAAAFGEARRVGAVTIFGAGRLADGTVAIGGRGAPYFGEMAGGSSPRVDRAVEIMQAAGIPTEATPDIQSVLWSKECNAAGVFGVSCLSRTSAGGFGSSPDLVRAYVAIIREVGEVAAAFGVRIGDYLGFPIKTYLDHTDDEVLAIFAARATPLRPGAVESYPSMTQDLLAGRPMEVDQIFADVVERAARVGIPVPRLTLVRDLMRGIDPGRRE